MWEMCCCAINRCKPIVLLPCATAKGCLQVHSAAHSLLVLPPAGCATVAEVRKRGEDFWAEFEFYLSDLLVGCVLDVVLVSLMAPVAVLGGRAALTAGQSGLQRWLAGIPSAALEASVKGKRVAQFYACRSRVSSATLL